jgi:hypothetical protein
MSDSLRQSPSFVCEVFIYLENTGMDWSGDGKKYGETGGIAYTKPHSVYKPT